MPNASCHRGGVFKKTADTFFKKCNLSNFVLDFSYKQNETCSARFVQGEHIMKKNMALTPTGHGRVVANHPKADSACAPAPAVSGPAQPLALQVAR